VAHMGIRNAHKILIGKAEGRIPRCKWKDNTKWMLKQDGVSAWTGFIGFRTGSSGMIGPNKAGEFLHQMGGYQFLTKDSVPLSYSTPLIQFKETHFLPGDSICGSSAWEATYISDTFMLHKSPLQQQNLVLLSAFGGFLLATHAF